MYAMQTLKYPGVLLEVELSDREGVAFHQILLEAEHAFRCADHIKVGGGDVSVRTGEQPLGVLAKRLLCLPNGNDFWRHGGWMGNR